MINYMNLRKKYVLMLSKLVSRLEGSQVIWNTIILNVIAALIVVHQVFGSININIFELWCKTGACYSISTYQLISALLWKWLQSGPFEPVDVHVWKSYTYVSPLYICSLKRIAGMYPCLCFLGVLVELYNRQPHGSPFYRFIFNHELIIGIYLFLLGMLIKPYSRHMSLSCRSAHRTIQ